MPVSPAATRRMRTGTLAAVLIVLTALLAPQSVAQTHTDPVQTDSAIEVGDAAISDSAIRERIISLLREIDRYQDISVTVAGGVVTLTGQVLDTTEREELTSIVRRVTGVVAIENETEVNASIEARLEPAVQRLSDRGRNILANAPIFLVAIAALAIIAVLGWMLTTWTGLWDRLAPNRFIADIYRAVARIAFIGIGIVVALDILNATALLGAVLGAAGVVGLAIGFAVRDTVENFIASILLSLRQPFRPNDFIEIDGDQGSVARLTARATILISPDGNHIRIPNATVFKGRIINYTRDANRRFTFQLGVAAESDLAAALDTAVQALQALPFVLDDPPVAAWVEEVGDSNVVLTFAAWVDQTATDFPKARGEAIRTAKTALESADFGLPEPIYRVLLQETGRLEPPSQPAPPSQTASRPTQAPTTPLPSAADPGRLTDASEQAVARERSAQDTGDDLLRESRKTE